MRLTFTSNVALIALFASILAAKGADLPVPPVVAPVAPVLSPWDTFYVGGFLGASIATQTANEQGAHQFFAGTGAGGSSVNRASRFTPFFGARSLGGCANVSSIGVRNPWVEMIFGTSCGLPFTG